MNNEQEEKQNQQGKSESTERKPYNKRYKRYRKPNPNAADSVSTDSQEQKPRTAGPDNRDKQENIDSKPSIDNKPGIDNKPNIDNKQKNPKYQPRPQRHNNPNDINNGILISVVVPLLDEEESLPELSLQLDSELTKLVGKRWEVIFIDDGSKDNSYKVITEINNRRKNFKAIRFRRNYGKSAALQAGFDAAKGKIIITMDADLQDDPAEIQNLINKLKEGYDLVSGWKKKRKDPFIKKYTSRIFNFFTSVTSGFRLHDFNCGLKAYRSDCAKDLQVYGEMHRYLPALAHWDGYRVAEVPVKHHPRRYGKTKFGISRFVKGYLDLLTVLFTTRYFKRPLHFFGTFGSIFTLIGLIVNSYLVYEWIMGNTYLSNRPLSLFGIALIIVGVQLISIGLIGELIVKNSEDKFKVSIKDRIK